MGILTPIIKSFCIFKHKNRQFNNRSSNNFFEGLLNSGDGGGRDCNVCADSTPTIPDYKALETTALKACK